MSPTNESPQRIFIDQCIADFEQTLNWGPVREWRNFDFEKLSEEIQSKTGVNLSVTTLKRIFGKLKYDNDPSFTTLNTLVLYLGYEDWRDYVQQKKVIGAPGDTKELKSTHWRKRKLSRYWYFISLPLLIVLITAVFNNKNSHQYNPHDFSFTADKVYAEGVPNSVVFTYDAEIAETDSIFIVQTWDIRRKTLVSRTGHKHSAMYYYPGFFRTKLIIDDQVVKSHDLQVTSNGWLALVEMEERPVYFKKSEITVAEGVSVDEDLLSRYNFNISPSAPKVRFFHQGDLGNLMNDNFIFETELRNRYDGGNNACQYVEVLIQCKDDIIIIPLCDNACIGDAYLWALGSERKSVNSDLSGFGADLTKWTGLRVESKDKSIAFFVNEKRAESFVFPNTPTGIVGIQIRFNGPGEVKYARFYNGVNWIVLN